ncbi:hypothetical protein N7491_007329 [Penicillium cf. griseofulvum]|uniref:Uncharacterized protein n=1 Tax=Penicillium cf. griseofulvum TaxID=2972120 RepID=A0A9W9IZQ2_9EURO|nr:hypothetical protein N7472_009641 [Penicillium cf. griseofulvum]KAJ5430313.1 hypothetical protein N7491_007329 [Penicillium cf. griseofulvum]
MSSKTTRRGIANWGAWKLELWALVGSVLSFTIMVIVLAIFDGRPIFEWKSVTLNAIISVLSVAMKASLTFAVAELIGQWKWILFSRDERPLMDFERIDMATRGPWGSLRVLSRMRGLQVRAPLQLGALLIVLAIGLDPFSQQLLQLEQRPRFAIDESTWHLNPKSAFTTRAKSFNRGKTLYAHDWSRAENSTRNPIIRMTTELELSMQAAILNGLSRTRKVVDQQVTLQCPTGSCVWDQFQTLGVCNRCQDITSDLKRIDNFGGVYDAIYNDGNGGAFPKEKGTAFSLPNGHFLMNMDGCSLAPSNPCYDVSQVAGGGPATQLTMSSFGTGDPNKTNSMQDVNTLIWSMSIIHLDTAKIDNSSKSEYEYKWPEMPLLANECAIYYCVKTINSTMEGNILRENVSEATDAVRDPDSFLLSSRSQDRMAPENMPPVNESAPLEFNELYAYVRRDDLALHFPDNLTKPSYPIATRAVWALSQYMQNLFSTNITTGSNITTAISDVLRQDAVGYNGVIENEQSNPAAVDSVWNPDKLDLADTFNTLAVSITNEMREEYDGYTIDYVYGRTGTPTQFYKTRWGWIALHGVVLIGGAVFAFVTMIDSASPSKEIPVWKNSTLATISTGSLAVDALKGAETVSEMEKKARGETVMMQVGKASTSYQQINQNEDGK